MGEDFVLLDANRLMPLGAGHALAGRLSAVIAQGLGDATPAEADRVADGRAMLPLSPAHVRVTGNAFDGMIARWVRRSRLGWIWADGADAPLAEEEEAYLVEIWAGEVLLRSDSLSTPAWAYAPDAIAADLVRAGAMPLVLTVRQRGTHGPGPATRITLSL